MPGITLAHHDSDFAISGKLDHHAAGRVASALSVDGASGESVAPRGERWRHRNLAPHMPRQRVRVEGGAITAPRADTDLRGNRALRQDFALELQLPGQRSGTIVTRQDTEGAAGHSPNLDDALRPTHAVIRAQGRWPHKLLSAAPIGCKLQSDRSRPQSCHRADTAPSSVTQWSLRRGRARSNVDEETMRFWALLCTACAHLARPVNGSTTVRPRLRPHEKVGLSAQESHALSIPSRVVLLRWKRKCASICSCRLSRS